jgi:hypothetical protein
MKPKSLDFETQADRNGWKSEDVSDLKEATDQDQGRLRPSPEKAHSSLIRYRIFEFFNLNRTRREQATQWNQKVWIL